MLGRLMTPREQAVLLSVAGAIVLGAGALYFRGAAPDGPTLAIDRSMPALSVAEAAVVTPSTAPVAATRPARIDLDLRAPSPIPIAADPRREAIRVSVFGSVERPAVYEMEPGARVHDLIERAGGTTEHANLGPLNLSAVLIDRTTLRVPHGTYRAMDGNTLVVRGADDSWQLNPPQYLVGNFADLAVGVQGTPQQETAGQPVDVSGSTAAGVGLARASSTGLVSINHASPGDLQTLPGIGPALAQRIVAHRAENPFATIEDLQNVAGIGPKRFDAVKHLVTAE